MQSAGGLKKESLPAVCDECMECLTMGTTDNEIPAVLSINATISNFEIDFLSANSVNMVAFTM